MQNQFDTRTTTSGYDPAVSVGVPRAARDAGLRSYMLKVYNTMASGVLLTGIVAMLFANSGMAEQVFTGRATVERVKAVEAGEDRIDRELWKELGVVIARHLTCWVAYVNRAGYEDG